jgi:hypothetical protein
MSRLHLLQAARPNRPGGTRESSRWWSVAEPPVNPTEKRLRPGRGARSVPDALDARLSVEFQKRGTVEFEKKRFW